MLNASDATPVWLTPVLQLSFFGYFASGNIAESKDSAAIKTTETAKTTKAEPVNINIKGKEASLSIAAFISETLILVGLR
ncbi:hypothetical protein H6S82_21680 [Planktothrix sp. FACHB-1355]|uniref:Uncharacterized protein n=1 Tax=Aerosakkonema funiforme FACHB-1375 TaxID=2949571 RepID=A0A926ZFD5_9CYAN|nr:MULTISPECIES: hypothetical protein [Oscillatoriales]MBD2179962.1 hypothetical protein [Aerosakkonema funiforme FACHB-1375]MBD3561430.1 hypothetical protein [Planktothrix sp. FACHB-1355]